MKIKPVNNQILIKPDEIKKPVTKLVTSLDDPEPVTGTILKVGKYVYQVKVGNRVQWKELEGTWFDDLIMIEESSIQLVLE